MRPDMVHGWSCDEEHFEDDAALARHLAASIDAGVDVLRFMREGCLFRLTYQDERVPPPADPFWRTRTYAVELVTNSPNCTGGNLFTTAWPDCYTHSPVRVVAEQDSDDVQIKDGTYRDVLGVLTRVGMVMWPERYVAS